MSETYRKLNMGYQRAFCGLKPGPCHVHGDYIIIFLLAGSGSILIEQTVYHVKPGDLVIINNGESHQDLIAEEKAAEYVEIRFAPELLAPFSHTFNLYHCFLDRPKGARNKMPLTKPQKEKVRKHVHKIENLFNHPFYADEVLKHTALIELVFYINRLFLNFSPFEERPNLPENLSAVLDYIDDNIQNPLPLETLEKTFFIDKSYMGRLFQKYLNVSIHEYIVLQRIAKAKELLLDGYSASDAGRLSGFNDYSNFSKMFKKVTDVSPSAYIKSQHDETMTGVLKPYRRNSSVKLPDLVIIELSWLPENPAAGQNVTFKAAVKNIGDGQVPVGVILGVGFKVNDFTETWSDNYTLGLAPGESLSLSANNGQGGVPVWTAIPGIHQIAAHVDDIGRIDEVNKENNKLVKEMTVQEGNGTGSTAAE